MPLTGIRTLATYYVRGLLVFTPEMGVEACNVQAITGSFVGVCEVRQVNARDQASLHSRIFIKSVNYVQTSSPESVLPVRRVPT